MLKMVPKLSCSTDVRQSCAIDTHVVSVHANVQRQERHHYKFCYCTLCHLHQSWVPSPVHSHCSTALVEGRSYTSKKISQVCTSQKPIIIWGAPSEAAKFPSITTPLVTVCLLTDFPIIFLLVTLKNEQNSDIIYLKKISNKISKNSKLNKNREVRGSRICRKQRKKYEAIIKIFFRHAKSKLNYKLTIKNSLI